MSLGYQVIIVTILWSGLVWYVLFASLRTAVRNMCENNNNSPLNNSPSPVLFVPELNAFDIFGVRQSHLGKIAMPFTVV
jgi:hypothetical protein